MAVSMEKPRFTKKAESEDHLVFLLKQRGLEFSSEKKLRRILRTVGYYRLSGYLYPFREKGGDRFLPGTTLDKIWDLYTFDRKLRLTVMDAVSRIEIGIRTMIVEAHTAAFGGDPFVYAKRECFDQGRDFDILPFLKEIDKAVGRAVKTQEPCISHFLGRYALDRPPVWAVMEVVSLGIIENYYRHLPPKIKAGISNRFRITPKPFFQWLLLVKQLRNICAHQGRLWNRKIDMKISGKTKLFFGLEWLNQCLNFQPINKSLTLFTALSILLFMLHVIRPESLWRERVKKLIEAYPDIPRQEMGFPENWGALPLWREQAADT